MKESKPVKYQLSDRYVASAFPVEWNKLPDGVLAEISSFGLWDLYKYSKTEGLSISTVAYFRKVSRFKKDIIEVVSDDGKIIYGV